MTARVVCSYPLYDGALARKLGNAGHNARINVIGLFPSRAAFLRALQDHPARLVSQFDSMSTMARHMRTWGYAHEPSEKQEAQFQYCVLYVEGDLGAHREPVTLESVSP